MDVKGKMILLEIKGEINLKRALYWTVNSKFVEKKEDINDIINEWIMDSSTIQGNFLYFIAKVKNVLHRFKLSGEKLIWNDKLFYVRPKFSL